MPPTPPRDGASAPTCHVPRERIVSIEHPCIVKNFDNAFKSLGGEHQLKHVLEPQIGDSKKDGTGPILGVSLRPNDPFSKRLPSTAVSTQNVLVKVTVPSRTGRKRKRGSDEPFTDSSPSVGPIGSITGSSLLQRLRDNPDSYTMQAVGMIHDTHRFQTLPDLQLRAADVLIMRELRDHAMTPDYDTLKKFRLNFQTENNQPTAFPAPPSFIPAGLSHPYKHKQTNEVDSSQFENIKKRTSGKRGLSMVELGISLDFSVVPQGPPPSLGEPSGKITPKTVEALKAVFEERPIATLRAVEALNPTLSRKAIAIAIQYVGYYIKDGPWTGTIVKYGIDPRSDAKYRFYQTLAFPFRDINRIRTMVSERGPTGQKHIFDGASLPDFHRTWQLCDLTDPVLSELVNISAIRAGSADKKWGWYLNGTIGKLRVLVRQKMARIVNQDPPLTDAECRALAALPDTIAHQADCRLELGFAHLHRLACEVAREAINKGPNKFDRILKRKAPGVNNQLEQRESAVEAAAVEDVEEEAEGREEVDTDGSDETGISDGEQDEDGGTNHEGLDS